MKFSNIVTDEPIGNFRGNGANSLLIKILSFSTSMRTFSGGQDTEWIYNLQKQQLQRRSTLSLPMACEPTVPCNCYLGNDLAFSLSLSLSLSLRLDTSIRRYIYPLARVPSPPQPVPIAASRCSVVLSLLPDFVIAYRLRLYGHRQTTELAAAPVRKQPDRLCIYKLFDGMCVYASGNNSHVRATFRLFSKENTRLSFASWLHTSGNRFQITYLWTVSSFRWLRNANTHTCTGCIYAHRRRARSRIFPARQA